jgi:hypothetical protein
MRMSIGFLGASGERLPQLRPLYFQDELIKN